MTVCSETTSPYDRNNIFARILRGEIPCDTVHESPHMLAFKDKFPQAPLHILVIPKGPYVSAVDFYQTASAQEILGFSQGLADVLQTLDIQENGGRLISNIGAWGGQEIPHYHLHVLGGKALGPMVSKQ